MDNKATEEVVETVEALKSERDQLKLDLERLHCELAQTSHEKIQSAQYGLVLLDEKQVLQSRCEELEALYDTTRHELDLLKEAFAKSQTSQKVSASTGIEQEQTLLQESASREASLTCTLQDAERELKQVRQELERVNHEKERYLSENSDLLKQFEVFEWERRSLKVELKELKAREARLLSDNNELEEENISLQKQVSSLRSSQVEFEGAKHEVRRLQEEVDALNAQVEELTSLKHIAEKQLEEALEALQSEREQKYAFKKELDAKANSESLFSLNNLTFAGFRLGSKGCTSGSLESCFYGKNRKDGSVISSTVVSSVRTGLGHGGIKKLTFVDELPRGSNFSELELCGCLCLCCCSILKLALDGIFAVFAP